jgi:xylulokinase
MFGVPVVALQVTEAACFGAALLAGKAVGKWATVGDAAQALVQVREVFEPDETERRLYDERFALYRELYPTLRAWLHKVSGLSR